MKLSIIIPVYNVEKYVEKCIRSCIEQNISFEIYEIIIVNDGSTDESLRIIKSFYKEIPNIKLINQRNCGLSVARNVGLGLARGEYVWFVDSDDWILPCCLETLINNLIDLDVLALNYLKVSEGMDEVILVPDSSCETGIDLLCKGFHQPAQFYVYNRCFLMRHSLTFVPGLLHEDFEFTPRMLFFAKSLRVYTKPVYCFFQRPNSIMSSTNPKKGFDLLIVAKNIELFRAGLLRIDLDKVFYDLVSLAINNAMANAISMPLVDRKRFSTELYGKRYLFKCLRNSTHLKYRIEGWLFALMPKRALGIYCILKRVQQYA